MDVCGPRQLLLPKSHRCYSIHRTMSNRCVETMAGAVLPAAAFLLILWPVSSKSPHLPGSIHSGGGAAAHTPWRVRGVGISYRRNISILGKRAAFAAAFPIWANCGSVALRAHYTPIRAAAWHIWGFSDIGRRCGARDFNGWGTSLHLAPSAGDGAAGQISNFKQGRAPDFASSAGRPSIAPPILDG